MSEENKAESPKTFVSYSWSSPEHEKWVLELATELEESGVHVVLDKWDLREGADKYAFMEGMVTDPSIRKVIVVCDRVYAEKADGRQGGVGTETQIISKEVYDQVDAVGQEQKFVAVITEKDEKGEPFVPTFLKSRIYIDMSDPLLHAESFEQLLRWIYDKPLYTRPQRGKPPEHLFAEDKVNLGTSARFRLAIEAVRRDKASAPAAVRDYLNTFAENLEIFRIEESEEGKEFDEQVVESIDAFLPYRDELVDLFLTITQYRSDSEVYETIHAFFERVLPYGFWPAGYPQWTKWNADNFKFILYELFLYATATLIKSNRFDKVNSLLEQGYYFPPGSPEMSPGGLVPFTYFRNYLQSLEYRNQRLNLQRTDLVADLIKERAKRTDLTFDDIMQADFILYIRHQLNDQEGDHARHSWFPVTLLYAAERYQPFEIFARAQSAKYFDRIRTALGVSHKDELVKLIEQYQSGTRRPPQWHVFAELDPAIAMAVEKIATQP